MLGIQPSGQLAPPLRNHLALCKGAANRWLLNKVEANLLMFLDV
jgi:hypothetical protein